MRPAKKRILRVLFLIAVRITKSKLEITLRTYAPGEKLRRVREVSNSFSKKKSNRLFLVDKKRATALFLFMKNDSDTHIKSAVKWLLSKQCDGGYWNAELETNCCMEAQWLMASKFCGIKSGQEESIIKYIINS